MSISVLDPPSACVKRLAPAIPAEVEFTQRNEISGELLFARFALPCGWDKFERRELPAWEWSDLLAFATGGTPFESGFARGFFNRFFGRSMDDLFKYARKRELNFEGAWSYPNMLIHLLEHKGHAPECAAQRIIIDQMMVVGESPITGRGCQIYCKLGAVKFPFEPFFDLYDLRPKHGSEFLVHKHVIVAKL
jgi:hypothetical protein